MISIKRPVEQARFELERRGAPPADCLPPVIYDSWMRCIAYGLDSRHPPEAQIVAQADLRHEQQRYSHVRGLALAEMHALHMQIAGSNFMIAFASPEGMLLDIVSDNSFMDMSDATSIRPGAIWKEDVCGTNGLGTAAHLGRAVTVHGPEHFFSRYNNLTCTASPVFAPDGALCGLLDASSDCLSRQSHTQALVAMAATQIENGLFREQHRANIIIALHSRGEYLHTLSAGLLATDNEGNIVAANRAARALLVGLPALPGKRFSDVFRARFSSFVDEGRRKERQKLQDGVGSLFIATIQNPRQFPFIQSSPKPAPAAPKLTETSFVSKDPTISEIVRRVAVAATRKMPILIRGETGTGKEQLARYAHAASGRSGAFVPINCAALPESLIEAELFGYAEGSFTGARKGGSTGLFREADGGTLFLDEIGDMPVALQAVLLRFLDDWTIRPVGGGSRTVDVLLVSATNANLNDATAKGRFRSDLLYRLNTLDVTLPTLKQRTDFDDIARNLLHRIDPEFHISEAAIGELARNAWSGNIRELRSVLSRLTLNESNGWIDERAIEAALGRLHVETPRNDAESGIEIDRSLHELQRTRILSAYAQFGHNVSKTARSLGVSRNTIYRAIYPREK